MDDPHELSERSVAADQAQGPAAAKTPKGADRRIERLEDLYAAALDEPDPVRANLQAAAADLLEIGYRLGGAIKGAMRGGSNGMKACETANAAIASMALVHRQATRYLQLFRDRASAPPRPRG